MAAMLFPTECLMGWRGNAKRGKISKEKQRSKATIACSTRFHFRKGLSQTIRVSFLTILKCSPGCDCGVCCSECQDVDSDEEVEVFWDQADWKPAPGIIDLHRFSESLKANASKVAETELTSDPMACA